MGDDAELYIDMQESGFWDRVEGYTGQYDYEEEDIDGYEDEEIEFTRYFLVDYENVNKDGLNGITKLTEEDCVRIYYSEAAETITFGLHRRINNSSAHFDYIKVQMPIKNAVDCQILFDLRDLTKEYRNAEYFIVSKDTDFDKAIEEFNTRNLNVKKVQEIAKRNEPVKKTQNKKTEPKQQPAQPRKQQSQKSNKDKREAQIRSFFGQHFKMNLYTEHKEEIVQAILKAKTKQAVNNNLMKIYPSETVSVIYKTIQPLIKDLPGK